MDSLKFLVPVRQATPHSDMAGSFRKLGHFDTFSSDGSAEIGRNAPANRCENVTAVSLVEKPRTLTRSVPAAAKDPRSVS